MKNLKDEEMSIPELLQNTTKWTTAFIEKQIYPVGFYKKKAQNLLKIAEILHEDYSDDIPRKYEDLLKLPAKKAVGNLVWNQQLTVKTRIHVPPGPRYPAMARRSTNFVHN